jgi:dihydroorotate dehydrogenase electron transfer subunit
LGSDDPIVLVGGGMGVAPLLQLAKKLDEMKKDYLFLCGFKTDDDLFARDILDSLNTKIIMEAEDGFVTDHIPTDREYSIFACGPVPMYNALKTKFPGKSIEVSLETRMGCGYGVCMGCNVPAKKGGYFSVCKQGPVFDIVELGEI